MGRNWDAKINVGDVLVGKYGYEADIAEFYKVVKRTPKQVVLVELEQHRDYDGLMDWVAVPCGNVAGKPIRRKVKKAWRGDGEYVSISDYESAYVWDGKPESCYNYH